MNQNTRGKKEKNGKNAKKRTNLDILRLRVEGGVLEGLEDGLLGVPLVEEGLDLGGAGGDGGIGRAVNGLVLNESVLVKGIHINLPVLGLLAHINPLCHVSHLCAGGGGGESLQGRRNFGIEVKVKKKKKKKTQKIEIKKGEQNSKERGRMI